MRLISCRVNTVERFDSSVRTRDIPAQGWFLPRCVVAVDDRLPGAALAIRQTFEVDRMIFD
ncbi:MAG: hypothetical protein HY815_16445 [Candidatus Riflebacteria bacterium]|nr:hypothetical protein [Candidatus Riflebacteria bacterium]